MPLFENLGEKFMGITGIVYLGVIREQRAVNNFGYSLFHSNPLPVFLGDRELHS